MSKEIRNTVTDADINKLKVIKEELVFSPSPTQRRAKARYWARSEGLLGNPKNTSAQLVSSYINEPAIQKWWGAPGFKEWFFNEQETKERLEYLFMLALDTAEHVLLDENANANAKVQMIKVLAGLAGKDSSKDSKLLDENIQRLNAEQLREYIRENAPKLLDKESESESE